MSEENKDPRPRREKRMSVYGYLLVLFGVAFLLLLFAYLMQQRNSEEIMGNLNELRESMSSVHSLNELVEENRILREEKETLEDTLSELESQLARTESELTGAQSAAEEWQSRCDDAQGVIAAFRYVTDLRALCEQGRTEEAQALLEGLAEIDGQDEVEYYLTVYLSTDPDYPDILEEFAPLVEWREMKAELEE